MSEDRLDRRIDEIFKLHEQRRELQAQIKSLTEVIDQQTNNLMQKMDEVGTPIAKGSRASAIVTESVVPTVKDWDQVYEYIKDNDALYLLHRRVSSAPWKELCDAGDEVPGIEPFTKRGITLKRIPA